MNIYLYDQIANRVTSVALPAADLSIFGYTDCEIAILRPLAAALIDVKDIDDPKVANERLRDLIWGLGRRMVGEGHVRDIRISADCPYVLTPPSPTRYSIFVKFLYRHKGHDSDGRFILATSAFDAPDHKSVLKL